MKTLTYLLLAGLLCLLLPAVSASQPLPVQCPTSSGDPDGDGAPEATSQCSTPRCGCNCPVVGGGARIQAAGQDATVVAATSGCEDASYVHADPGQPDPTAPVVVTPIVITRIP
jgi:hypothetical protein